MTPAVSVLMPARNAAATLDEAIQSLVAQTFMDWELIVVDDGSTDATPGRLADWARRDRRIHILYNESGQGLVSSLNHALSAARGPVIARMDADDVSLPERFERQFARLEVGDISVVGCRVRYFPEEWVAGGARRYEEWLNSLATPAEHARDLFVECPLAHPTLMLRAEALRAVGGYQAHGWAEDYDLLLRVWSAGHRMAKVPETLFHWRENPARTSRTHPDYRPEAFVRCKAHYLAQTYLAAGRPAMVFGAGPVGKAMARALLDRGVSLRAFVDIDPRKVGRRIYEAPVFSREAGLALRGEVFGLAAVGRPGAREELRAVLEAAAWRDGTDFCSVA